MEDVKDIKVMFTVTVTSVISDTEDDTKGEAATAYKYMLDTSLPELAYAMAGFLKLVDDDPDIKKNLEGVDRSVGAAFIMLLQSNYDAIK